MRDKDIITFKCHKISGGVGRGVVLISKDDICFYLIDPETGKVIEKNHSLEGQSIAGKVLVFPSGKGSSVVQADGLYQLAMKGNAPRAMIIEHPDTVTVASSIILEMPLVDRVDKVFYETAEKGDRAEVDADKALVTIFRGESRT